jgi:hypothetical protein
LLLIPILAEANVLDLLAIKRGRTPSEPAPACCKKFLPLALKHKAQIASQIESSQKATMLRSPDGTFAGSSACLFHGAEIPCHTMSSVERRLLLMSLQL